MGQEKKGKSLTEWKDIEEECRSISLTMHVRNVFYITLMHLTSHTMPKP